MEFVVYEQGVNVHGLSCVMDELGDWYHKIIEDLIALQLPSLRGVTIIKLHYLNTIRPFSYIYIEGSVYNLTLLHSFHGSMAEWSKALV